MRMEQRDSTGQLIMMTPTEEFLYNSYNQLKVLEENFKTVFGGIPLVMESFGIFFVVLNLFIAVTFQDISSLVKALLLLYLVVTCFSLLAQVYSSSSDAIETWKRNTESGEIGGNAVKKFRRSVRPLRVSIGAFFLIDKPFILTFISIIVDQAVNLIISFN